MTGRAYSPEFRRAAVALGRAVGADIASRELGITGKDTLRNWMLKAGDPPELAGEPDDWRTLSEIALARATALVATGKLTAVQLATVGAIGARNARKAEAAPSPATTASHGATNSSGNSIPATAPTRPRPRCCDRLDGRTRP